MFDATLIEQFAQWVNRPVMIPAGISEHQLLQLHFNFTLSICVKFHGAIAKFSKLMVGIELFAI